MSYGVVGQRSRYVSHIQKKLILKYLGSNPNLLSPKFSTAFKFRDAQMKWTEMANMLNRVPGSKKDWKQWRKTWHDMRSKTKLKLQQGHTVFSKIEKDILMIIGELPSKDISLVYDEVDVKKEETDYDSSSEINLDQFVSSSKDPLDTVVESHIQNVIIETLPAESDVVERMCEDQTGVLDGPSLEEELDELVGHTEISSIHGGVDKRSVKHKRSYYERKLMVLNRLARAKEKSAAAKERIAEALEKIAGSRMGFI